MNETLRDNLWELFPDCIIYNSPVSDDNIVGVALIYDNDFHWVVVYDENLVLNTLIEEFSESTDAETDAIEYYNYNIIGGYHGPRTPLFMHNFEENECIASRCSQTYESYICLQNIESMQEAFEIVREQNVFLYVPLDSIESIKQIV